MRSFIKSHRKTESNTSDLNDHTILEYPQPLHITTTPIPSPKLSQFTPPPSNVSGTSLSSPKKLLTPIKNLFSSHHHSKSLTNTPSFTNDNLQNITTTSPKHRFIKKSKNKQQELDQLELDKPEFKPSFRKVTSSPSLHIFYPSNTRPPPRIVRSQNRVPRYDGISINSPYLPNNELGPPISFNEVTASDISITESENFQTKKVEFDEEVETDIPTLSEDDDDNSSQFSFVQDMKGGRNTSIKYYKNKATPAVNKSNTFNEHDLQYEVDEFSDYDFENNGMDEEGIEEDIQYNKLFADEEEVLKPTIDTVEYSYSNSSGYSSGGVALFEPKIETETPVHIPDCNPHHDKDQRIFNESFHLSIQGPIESTSKQPSPQQQQPQEEEEEDLLENYLDDNYIASRTTPEFTSPNYELFDLHSPMINGLTIGYRIPSSKITDDVNKNRLCIHRNPIALNESGNNETIRYWHSFHESLDEGLHKEIDEKVSSFQEFIEKRNEPVNEKVPVGLGISTKNDKQMRNSILDMMDILSSLEQKKPIQKRSSIVDMMNTLANLETTEQRRNSIYDMMNTLANLDLLNNSENEKPKQKQVEPFHTPIIKEYLSDKDTSMDQDLLDEINQLPEDYEFDQEINRKQSPNFCRSNSYHKKPTKTLVSMQYQSNKIETLNKTVTFYKNNYSAPSLDRSESISRDGSTRSYNSCTSVKEDNEEEEEVEVEEQHRFKYSQFFDNSSESFSQNLKTIEESPLLR